MENYVAKTIKLDQGEYVPVHERIKEFWSKYPFGFIEPRIISELPKNNGDLIIFKAIAYRYPGDTQPGVGHSQTIHGEGHFSTSALEIAETSAVGRALGMLGIGVKGVFASADEVNKSVAMETTLKKVVKKEQPKKLDESSKFTEDEVKKLIDTSKFTEEEAKMIDAASEDLKNAKDKTEVNQIWKAVKASELSDEAKESFRKLANTRIKDLNKETK